ncbi:MAG: hypothetical protein WC511_02370 [Candidatus Pacearchaeota archaeon]
MNYSVSTGMAIMGFTNFALGFFGHGMKTPEQHLGVAMFFLLLAVFEYNDSIKPGKKK